MPTKPIWVYEYAGTSHAKALVCTRRHCVIETDWRSFDELYDTLFALRWPDLEVIEAFARLAHEVAPQSWLAPRRDYEPLSPGLSQCWLCHAIVPVHTLDVCRWCRAHQPETVRQRWERQAAFVAEFHRAIDKITSQGWRGRFNPLTLSDIETAISEAETACQAS